jgi:hypothetical protein
MASEKRTKEQDTKIKFEIFPMVSFGFSSSCGRLKNLMCQKVSFVLACFEASAAPRPENPNSDEKDALFGLDTQMTIFVFYFSFGQLKFDLVFVFSLLLL